MNDHQEARRLEERALNASGAFQSIIYDGWLLGYRPGPTKRLRCVNPFYPSTVPIPEKIAYCAAFYASVGLPAVFRLLPFSEPPELDGWLEDHGWVRFERTLVAQARLEGLPAPALAGNAVAIVDAVEWIGLSAELLDVGQEVMRRDTDCLPARERFVVRAGHCVVWLRLRARAPLRTQRHRGGRA